MNIYVWDKELKSLSKGTTSVKEVYVWDTKIRPTWPNTQWPCPDGYHVPTSTEMGNLMTIANWWILDYLKLPKTWYVSYNTQWKSWGQYWYLWTANRGYSAFISSNSSYRISNWDVSIWCWLFIRPFKNEPVTPDASWTTLKSWTWWSWIYWKESLWLISASSEWNTWITITDKNLWATRRSCFRQKHL